MKALAVITLIFNLIISVGIIKTKMANKTTTAICVIWSACTLAFSILYLCGF